MNSLPLFAWLALTHSDKSRDIFLLLVVSSAAVVGAVPALTLVSLNATVTLTVVSPVSRAVPFTSFTKSRPFDNSSRIVYTYWSYPVVSGTEPVTVYLTT